MCCFMHLLVDSVGDIHIRSVSSQENFAASLLDKG